MQSPIFRTSYVLLYSCSYERKGEETMKVKIYSRKRMEKLLNEGELKNTAVISFHDPQNQEYSLPPIDFSGKCARVIHVGIIDIAYDELDEYGLNEDTYFPEAEKVAKFIYEAKSDGLDIICQCEHGQSRSAGCAAAILQHFSQTGINVFTNYNCYPNVLIYHKIFNALESYKGGKI